MKLKYNEEYKHEKGFIDFFNTELEPLVRKVEKHRKASLFKFWGVLLCYIAILAIGAITGNMIVVTVTWVLIIPFIILLVYINLKFKEEAKIRLNNLAARFYGDFIFETDKGINENTLEYLKFVYGDYDRITFKDYIHGTYKERPIEISEIDLFEENDTGKAVRFQGLVISITFPRKFSGTTLLYHEKLFQSINLSNYTEKFDSKNLSEFNNKIQMYSSDLTKASKILSPELKEKINNILEIKTFQAVDCCFKDNKAVIGITTPYNLLESVSLFTSAYSEKAYKSFLKDFHMILELAETISKYFEQPNK